MAFEQAQFSPMARWGEHDRHRRTLHAFLLVSVAAHAAVIVGLPDFLPQFVATGPSVLEVTILAPRPMPAPPAQPEPAAQARPTEESRAREPRPSPAQKPAREVARPGGGAPAQPAPAQAQDAEVVGSFSVGSSRGIAPLATVPDAAAEAVAQQVMPPIFDAAYLNNPEPPYPPAAVRAGQQGTVMLRVMVKRDGLPTRVEIEKSSGSRALDTAAQDAVWSWRFVPARQGTDPIESWVMVPVVFRLKEAR
jgi:periplasmic protein TonB